jgi:hypothetical protein
MKNILFCLMAVLCVMGVSAQSHRSMSTTIPTEYQIPVNVTIDDQAFNLIPTKATLTETDSCHVRCYVYHNRGKASVNLPISYDFCLDVAMAGYDVLYRWCLISEEQYNAGKAIYEKQRKR